jgi:hypothetical protein
MIESCRLEKIGNSRISANVCVEFKEKLHNI